MITVPPGRNPKNLDARRGALIVLAILAVGGLLFTVLTARDDGRATDAQRSDGIDPPLSKQTTTTVGPDAELISRLSQILADREMAYRKRDPELLREIYTVDCPCLESDSNAIRELIREDYVWVGGETSIRVRSSKFEASNRVCG